MCYSDFPCSEAPWTFYMLNFFKETQLDKLERPFWEYPPQ